MNGEPECVLEPRIETRPNSSAEIEFRCHCYDEILLVLEKVNQFFMRHFGGEVATPNITKATEQR